MLISVCIIARDEAATLPATLISLARPDLVAEIVVADTGSRDDTPRIAEEAGCRVLRVPWQDSFSAARNAALRAARAPYCLMIDADEVVEQETWPALSRFLEGGRPLGRIVQISPSPWGTVRESLTRLCRNDPRYRYSGRVHEQLSGPGPGGDTGLCVLHSGYSAEALARKGTARRNLALLEAELADHPGDPYLRYQIGRTLWQDDPAAAIPHLQAALRGLPPTERPPYLPSLVRELGYALRACQRSADALALLRTYRPLLPDFTDLVFLQGLLHMDLDQAGPMLEAFLDCLRLGEPTQHASTVEGVGSYRPLCNLALFFELTGQREQARAHYTEALRLCPGFTPAAEGLARLG